MFGNHENDLIESLRTMKGEALRRSNYNQVAARGEMISMIRNDRRLDAFDPERLVDQVHDCSQTGRKLNWDDPALKRGPDQRSQSRPIVFNR